MAETQEGADFRGSLGRWDLPYGCEERGIWQKALFGNPVPQVADLFRCKRTLLSPQLEIGVPESLKNLSESSEVLLPGGGEDDNVV